MKPTASLRAATIALAALGISAAIVSCSSNDQPTKSADQSSTRPPSSPTTTPSYDASFAFVVADQGLVSMPLPADAVAAPGDHVDFSLTNQSHSGYRIQLFDSGHKLVQQMAAAAGRHVDMVVVMGPPGLYTVEFRPAGGHGQPIYAAVTVKR